MVSAERQPRHFVLSRNNTWGENHDTTTTTSFAEKSPVPSGPGLVSAGIYLTEPEAVGLIPERTLCDFGADVFPAALEEGNVLHAHVLTAEEGLWWSDTEGALDVTRSTFRPRSTESAG